MTRDICGTVPGYSKHERMGEPRCAPCREARRISDNERNGTRARVTAEHIAEEIEHLLRLNEGYAYILAAIGYTGRETSLEKRLRTNGHSDLYRRLFADKAAA